MTVASAIVAELVAHDIDAVFGVPGIGGLGLIAAIQRTDTIRYVMARHETAVSHQAWGYAQASGDPAATFVIPGPGDMNAMNGLKSALNDCTPLLHLTAETESDVRGGDPIHEAPSETYDNVVKDNVPVGTPEAVRGAIQRAIAVAQTPPKGPVRVGVPIDFLPLEVADSTAGAYVTEPFGGPPPNVDAAVELLAGADSTVIVAGGGIRASDAGQELRDLAETLDAPVVTSRKGKGVLPEDHPLSAGDMKRALPELRSYIADADVAIGAGTDFDALATLNWSIALPDSLVQVGLHPGDFGRGYEPTVSLVGDAKAVLGRLAEDLQEMDTVQSEGGAAVVRSVRETVRRRLADLSDVEGPPLTSVAALRTIRSALPRETIVSTDVGGFRTWTFLPGVFESYGARRQIQPGSWGSMGTGVPGAIGAQVAHPDVPVVTLAGDGGVMMNVQELHTAVAEGLPITVFVFANDDYAIIGEGGHREYDTPQDVFAWPDAPIDFVSLAESMGVSAQRAGTAAALSEAATTAVAASDPRLIEIPIDPNEPQVMWWLGNR